MLTRPAGLLSVPKTTSTRLPPLMERTWSEKPPWRVAGRKNDLTAAYGPPAAVSPTMQRRQAKQLAAERRARRAKAADLSPPPKSPPQHVRTHSRMLVVAATRRNQLPTDEASAALEDLADFEAKHVASSAGDKSKALHDFSVATLNVGAYMLGDKEAPTDELRRGRAAMHGAGFAGFDDRALLRCVCAEIIDRVDQLGLGPLVLCLQEEVLERTARGYEPAFLALYERAGFRLVACEPSAAKADYPFLSRHFTRPKLGSAVYCRDCGFARQREVRRKGGRRAGATVKLGRLGTLTNVHLCGGRSPADAVAAEREREQREGADASPPLVSGAAGGGGFNALLHGTNSPEKRTSPAPRASPLPAGVRWRKGSLSGLPVSGAPGDSPRRLSLANVVQVQQAVVSARNDLDLFKAARLKRAELERALGADKAIGSAKGAAVVCGDFGATIDDFFSPPMKYLRQLHGGLEPTEAQLDGWREWACIDEVMYRRGFSHTAAKWRETTARGFVRTDVPSTPPFGTRETQEEKRARKAAADEGKAAVDWIWYDRTKLRVQSAGVAPMFGDALVGGACADHHLVYASFAPVPSAYMPLRDGQRPPPSPPEGGATMHLPLTDFLPPLKAKGAVRGL